MTVSLYPRCSIQETLLRRMSFDLNQFDDDHDDPTEDDCFEYDIEDEKEEIVKLKKDDEEYDDIQTTLLRKMSFDFNQFDDPAFDSEEEEEEEEIYNEQMIIKMEKRLVDGNIQNTLLKNMSFDINQFNDSFDFDVEQDEDEDDDDHRRDAVSEEMVRIQKMNNISATWIEVGNHDKAIENLGKTLKSLQATSRYHQNHQSSSSCASTCFDGVHSLDECINHSSKHQQNFNFIENLGLTMKKNKKIRGLHRTPIHIPEYPIHDWNTTVESTTFLFFILTFNLALSHHLKLLNVLKNTTKKGRNSSSTVSRLVKSTIRLYELLLNVGNNSNNNNDKATAKSNGKKRFNKIVLHNLNLVKNDNSFEKKVEDTAAAEKTKTVKLVLKNPPPSSLYEQHKALLRQRYSLPSTSSSSFSSTSKTLTKESSSSSSLNVKDKGENGFSLCLQNAIRTSSSFVHLQQRKNVSTAFAA